MLSWKAQFWIHRHYLDRWWMQASLSCLFCFLLDFFDPILLSFLRRYKITKFSQRSFSTKQLLHSTIIGLASVYVVIFEPGLYPQPEASFLCEFDHSSFWSVVIPRISLGYAVHDILDGVVQKDLPFFLHGVGLGGMLLYMEYQSVTSVAVYPLTMEISTIFFTLRGLNWRNSMLNDMFDVLFAITFLLLRFIILNKWLFSYLLMGLTSNRAMWGSCMSDNVLKVVAFIGLFFNLLNIYWGKTLVYKIRQKISICCCNWDPEKKLLKKKNKRM